MPTLSSNNTGAVSWGAVFAGAACASALSFILLMLGFGFGLTAVSPWTDSGASAETLGVSTIIWVIVIQLAASGLGGYLAGRLRVKWPGINNDEVYFRDTAHGLITWSVSTLVVVIFMAGSIHSLLSSGAKAGAELTEAAGPALERSVEEAFDSPDYYIDALLRGQDAEQRPGEEVRGEVTTIVVRSLREGELIQDDQQYLANLVARHTELSQQQAGQRVSDIYNRAEEQAEAALEALDDARSAAARTALWMFLALLIGAFFASLMATFGGRQRDSLTEN
ncbi:hypothetical protein CWE09_04780 [Aliidiomarina minuta]|uniref:Transmembrane protein n=1 Tax=Aliidiomarina minuta TaxID=880057 RepID=A0A432W7L4_9GAMM|nr:hypothetical protein [Aliidiomarina minuta]RUO26045.1 hypothetical protein CWE09_04780 [Aliidiomarina minuta]